MATVPDNYESGNDLATETDAEFFCRLDHQDATTKARLVATYPVDREPTESDWADYNEWSKALHDHDAALALFMVFCDDEGKSTYYVS